MDYRSLVNKLEAIQAGTYIKEASAPISFVPTHFHKGNLGNKLPIMMTEPGVFWWEGGNQGGEGDVGGSRIVPWQGDAENRSGWNPASIDGVIKDGKYIDFPEGVTWKQFQATQASDTALLAKLKKLLELIEKYNALRARRGQGGKPAGLVTTDMGDGSKMTTDNKGNFAATNDDGTPYIPGSNPNLPKNKVGESRMSISQSLLESFGYELYELTNTMNPNNPNAAFKDMPGAGQVTKDLGGGNTLGSVGQKRAQQAADQALQRGRTASADALNAFKPGAAAPATTAAATGAKTAAATGAKTALKTAAGTGSKILGKALPGVGAYLGATSAIDSYKKGDYLGAALNGLSGAFSLVPGLGWIPAVGLGAWQAGRELSGATDKYDQAGAEAPATSGQGGTPSTDVKALQQRILAKDPNALPQHGADGRMGPETQAAMKRLNIKENMMPQKSLAETMRDLQQRLIMLEEPTPEVPEAIPPTADELAIAEKAKQVGAEIGKIGEEVVLITKDKQIVDPTSGEILKNNNGQLASTGQMFEPTMAEGYDELEEGIWDSLLKGAARLGRTGAVVGRRAARLNPGKTALGVGAAGLAGGYASGSAGGTPTPATTTPPVRPPSTGGQSGQGGTPTTPDTSADDAEMAALKAQIEALIKELSTSKNPEIQKGLADAQAKLK